MVNGVENKNKKGDFVQQSGAASEYPVKTTAERFY